MFAVSSLFPTWDSNQTAFQIFSITWLAALVNSTRMRPNSLPGSRALLICWSLCHLRRTKLWASSILCTGKSLFSEMSYLRTIYSSWLSWFSHIQSVLLTVKCKHHFHLAQFDQTPFLWFYILFDILFRVFLFLISIRTSFKILGCRKRPRPNKKAQSFFAALLRNILTLER